VRRESIKRFAHFIFINDTQHSCVYGHQGIMSVWEMKLAMPCSDALWSAPTPQEWRRIMTEERKARAHETHPITLLDIVTAFVSPNSNVSGIDPRSVPLDGLGLYAVVHGIFSVAWHFKNRKIPHHWANVMQIKIEEQQDGDEDVRWLLSALHEWKTRHNMFWASAHYPMGYQPPSPMWSPPFRIAAIAIYDLACIWLQAPVSDIQMAAGSRFAHGRVISKQRAQQSWLRINRKLLTDDVCHHALNLVEAELLYKNEATGQSGLHSYLTDPSYPLFMPFVAYLGGLALWAYASNLDRQSSYPLQRSSVALDQNTFHVDSYGMTEYPRLNPSTLSTSSTHHFSSTDDYNEVIRTLRGNLTLTFGNTGGISPSAPGFFPKSPNTPATGFPHLGDHPPRLSMFKQGIDILLSHLRAQLDGHRWEIARESFEILQGTVNGRDYQ
jgi:Fungal specific transcription factor domain